MAEFDHMNAALGSLGGAGRSAGSRAPRWRAKLAKPEWKVEIMVIRGAAGGLTCASSHRR